MSAPTPAPGDDRPREGYYPDPSIPGYVRYWNGASWVPGTSRPAPADGEPLAPPGGAPAPVEETGPHFFDEDPADAQHGSRPEPATAWTADRAHQQGFGGDQDRRVSWGSPQDPPGVQQGGPQGAQQAQTPQGGAPGAQGAQGAQQGPAQGGPQGAQQGGAQGARQGAQQGLPPAAQQGGPQGAQQGGPQRAQQGAPQGAQEGVQQSGPQGTQQGSPHGAQQGAQQAAPQGAQHGGPQGAQPAVPHQNAQGADPRVPGGNRPADGSSPAQPDGHAARTDGTATIPPAEPDEDGGTRVFRRTPAGGGSGPGADEGTMKFRALSPRTAQQSGGPGAQSGSTPGPAYSGPTAGPTAQGAANNPGAPGFGAGKAAAERAAAAPQGPATALSGPQQSAPAPGPQTAPPGVPQQGQPQQGQPHQGVPQQSAGAQSAAPMAAGPGGGQPSWAQQVHRLAGPDEEQPAPWKPPVEDIFQAAARRQASARPASLGKRLAARLLDTLVVGAVTAVAAVPLGTKAADHIGEKVDAAKLSGETVTIWLLDGTTSVYLAIVVAVLLVTGALYEALPTAKWGRTLGKKLFGLEVRDIEGHQPPTLGGALRRWLVYSVPGLLGIGLVGVAWCLFDRPWHQCWHDKAAHTFVAG